jgi:hypothetical protein
MIQGSTEAQQRSTKMDSRTTHRTLSSKRTPLQTGINGSHLWEVPRGRWISHTCPLWLWDYSPFVVSSPGPVFYGARWLLWRPHKWTPAVHLECGIDKGANKRGSTIDQWWSQCRGLMRAASYTYNTYIKIMQWNLLINYIGTKYFSF